MLPVAYWPIRFIASLTQQSPRKRTEQAIKEKEKLAVSTLPWKNPGPDLEKLGLWKFPTYLPEKEIITDPKERMAKIKQMDATKPKPMKVRCNPNQFAPSPSIIFFSKKNASSFLSGRTF
jgi:hypothetical protein